MKQVLRCKTWGNMNLKTIQEFQAYFELSLDEADLKRPGCIIDLNFSIIPFTQFAPLPK